MKFKIPFTFASIDKLKKRSEYFRKFVKENKKSKIHLHLESIDLGLSRQEYVSICLRGLVYSFLVLFVLFSTLLFFLGIGTFLFYSLGLAVLFSGFLFFTRMIYPKVYSGRRQKEIEANLIPALDDMLVQLNSGVPLFSIIVNISSSDYGELSEEFKKIARKINAGLPEADVLDEMGEKNPSVFFRRTLWQISNGMKAGSDISIVIRESIRALTEEQLIQIQNYGNKLNPMIMFYMLVSVILPALAITFMTVVTSLINLSSTIASALFIILFFAVVFVQIMFLGIIKSIRPSLL